ncbi:MAG: beta strand repeat-containing protein [Kiritimatiellia bacterium]|jgi:fibronectin-binding autotransporter adhesin
MKMTSIHWIAVAFALAFLPCMLAAKNIYWDGGPSPHEGTNWNEAVNWKGDVKPGADDTALFSNNNNTGVSTANKTIMLGAPQVIHTVNFPSWAQIPGGLTIGSVQDVAEGNALTIKGGVYRGDNLSNWQTFRCNIVLDRNTIWEINPGYNGGVTVSGGISGTGHGLAKWGSGTLILQGANTYAGNSIIRTGTLQLNFNAETAPLTNIVNPASPLVMEGGYLHLMRKPANSCSQTFDGVAAASGASTVRIESNRDANAQMAFGTFNRMPGATLNLRQPSGQTTISAENGFSTSQENDPTGILGAYLTVSPDNSNTPADWAANNGVNIVAYDNYATLFGDAAVITDDANSNVQIDNTTTGTVSLASSNVTINTLKASGTTARVVDLGGGTLRLGAVGGILAPGSTGALTLTNGTLTAGGADNTSGEIVFINATTITNDAVIADNGAGAIALTKSGGGTLQLTTAQTHTGGTYVNAGTLQLPTLENPLATNANIVVCGGTLNLGAGTQNLSSNFVMRGGTLSNGTIVKSGADYAFEAGAVSATLDGAVGLVKTSPGATTFTGANTYTGDTYILEGSARFERKSAIVKGNLFVGSPDGTIPASVFCVNTPLNSGKNWTVYKNCSLNSGSSAQYLAAKLTLVGGSFTGSQPYFQYGSSVEMTGGTFGGSIYGNGPFGITSHSNDVPAVVSASIRNNNHKFTVHRGSGPIDLIFSGNMVGNNTLTKEGDGVMTMTGSEHSNGTVLNAGTLLVVNTSGSGTGFGPVTVKAGTTFGGTGFIVGSAANVTATGSSDNPAVIAPGTPDPDTGDHVIGTLTVGSDTQANNVTFADNSALAIAFDTEGNCDKLVVNGTLSLDSATDKLTLDIADYDALKPGTYTLATFTALATPGAKFDIVEKPARGTLAYTPTSIEYTVHPRGTVVVVK